MGIAKHDAHDDGKPYVARSNYDLAACANYELNELVQRYGAIRARLSKARALGRALPLRPPDADTGHTSPPPSPPDSDDEDDEEERRMPEATPANRSPPSPPPSPPQPLSTRLGFLRAAEEAVAATYAYPRYPEGFIRDVQPYILRYIQSEGKKAYKSTTHAVYAVLVPSDPRTEAASEAVVARTLHGSPRTMRDWKKIIDYRRAEAVDAATPLTMASSPPASAPPSPAETDTSEAEGLSTAFAALPPSLGDASAPTAGTANEDAMDAVWGECDVTLATPANAETSPSLEERVTWRIQNDADLAALGAPRADPPRHEVGQHRGPR